MKFTILLAFFLCFFLVFITSVYAYSLEDVVYWISNFFKGITGYSVNPEKTLPPNTTTTTTTTTNYECQTTKDCQDKYKSCAIVCSGGTCYGTGALLPNQILPVYPDCSIRFYNTTTTTTTTLPCLTEGQSGAVVPNAPSCCSGLTSIGCDRPDSNNTCPTHLCAGAFFCTKCGNGVCGPGENKCNCPKDCAQISCTNDFDCPEKMKCQNSTCVDVGCIGEGKMAPGPVSPDYIKHMATECCQGLESIMYSGYFDQNCNPTGLAGAGSVCSKCGNGICESWETKCTCPQDCNTTPTCNPRCSSYGRCQTINGSFITYCVCVVDSQCQTRCMGLIPPECRGGEAAGIVSITYNEWFCINESFRARNISGYEEIQFCDQCYSGYCSVLNISNAHIEVVGVGKINPSANQTLISIENVTIKTQFSPDEIINIALNNKTVDSVNKVEISKTTEGKIEYKLIGQKNVKILWLIPATAAVERYFDSYSGNSTSIVRPWWYFLVTS